MRVCYERFLLGYVWREYATSHSIVTFYDTNEPFFCVTLFVYWLQIERKTLDGAVNSLSLSLGNL